MARLTALARRRPLGARADGSPRAISKWTSSRRAVRRGGETIDLQPREFRLLEFLMRSEGQIVTRKMLLEQVWDFHFDPKTNIVETHISRLRGKIDRGGPVADPDRARRGIYIACPNLGCLGRPASGWPSLSGAVHRLGAGARRVRLRVSPARDLHRLRRADRRGDRRAEERFRDRRPRPAGRDHRSARVRRRGLRLRPRRRRRQAGRRRPARSSGAARRLDRGEEADDGEPPEEARGHPLAHHAARRRLDADRRRRAAARRHDPRRRAHRLRLGASRRRSRSGRRAACGSARSSSGRIESMRADRRAPHGRRLERPDPADPHRRRPDRARAHLQPAVRPHRKLMRANKQVSADIAHDLRKPLAGVLRRLEAARDDPSPDAARARSRRRSPTSKACSKPSTRSCASVRSRRAPGAPRSGRSISPRSREDTETFAPAAEDEGKTLVAARRPLPILGDRELLVQMVANLIDNALRHTPDGSAHRGRRRADARRDRFIGLRRRPGCRRGPDGDLQAVFRGDGAQRSGAASGSRSSPRSPNCTASIAGRRDNGRA